MTTKDKLTSYGFTPEEINKICTYPEQVLNDAIQHTVFPTKRCFKASLVIAIRTSKLKA
jgi:hypothetical protein